MSTATLPEIPIPDVQHLVAEGVSWDRLLEFTERLGERNVRLTYDRGRLEFMTVTHLHEIWKMLLHSFIEVLTDEFEVLRKSCGSGTFMREDLLRAVEPDQCYYLTNEPLVRTRDQIDLQTDPPPDLFIEVEISRTVVDRLSVLAALSVPEVWCCSVDSLRILHLRDGEYVEATESRYFPGFPIPRMHEFLQRHGEMDDGSLVRSFRTFVQEWLEKQSTP